MKKVLFAATTALLLSVSSAAMAADAADKFVGKWIEDTGIITTLIISKVSKNEVHIEQSSKYGGDSYNYFVDDDKLLILPSKRFGLTLTAPNVLKGDGSEYFKQ